MSVAISSNPILTIGIDPGTETGIAVWNKTHNRFEVIDCLKIHQAIREVLYWTSTHNVILVRVESAKTWKPFSNSVEALKKNQAKLKGAGSIIRDTSIWEDFLLDEKINHELVSLQSSIKKLKHHEFSKLTNVNIELNEHARDAAMLVYNPKMIRHDPRTSQHDQPVRSRFSNRGRKSQDSAGSNIGNL